MEAGCRRWCFNFEGWKPSESDWEDGLSEIQEEERERIGRFKRPLKTGPLVGKENPDAKSSLIGRLMIRKLMREELGVDEFALLRTKQGKPFLKDCPRDVYPNFNFNVSHSGDFVVLASDPYELIGVDVMEEKIPRAQTETKKREFFQTMRHCFTSLEWREIYSVPTIKEQEAKFFQHWTLKESYIKAVGIGLGFELQRAEFTLLEGGKEATVSIDGKPGEHRWRFGFERIWGSQSSSGDPVNPHIVAVALGPLSDAHPDYRCALDLTAHPTTKSSVNIPFTHLSFADLISPFP